MILTLSDNLFKSTAAVPITHKQWRRIKKTSRKGTTAELYEAFYSALVEAGVVSHVVDLDLSKQGFYVSAATADELYKLVEDTVLRNASYLQRDSTAHKAQVAMWDLTYGPSKAKHPEIRDRVIYFAKIKPNAGDISYDLIN